MHDYLLAHQGDLTTENEAERLVKFSGSLRGVRPDQVRACVGKHVAAPGIQSDAALAAANHVTGTPTAFVNGQRAGSGAPTREHLLALIREASQEAAPSAQRQ